MKRIKSYLAVAIIFSAISLALAWSGKIAAAATAAAKGADAAAAEQKRLALANPYPNDLGPAELDDATIKSYPAKFFKGLAQAKALVAKNDHDGKMPADAGGYALLLVRCSACHSSSRPLNGRFVEPEVPSTVAAAKRDDAQKAAIAKLKTEHPEFFKNPAVWQIESEIWSRYVHRMMNKPGCPVKEAGKNIWEFLVYDGSHRKIGSAAAAWKAHREDLVKKFKAQNPKRYEDLAKDNDL